MGAILTSQQNAPYLEPLLFLPPTGKGMPTLWFGKWSPIIVAVTARMRQGVLGGANTVLLHIAGVKWHTSAAVAALGLLVSI
jgi:hypothetical protein